MVNDIIKNILIKLRVDDRDLKKVQEGLLKGTPGGSPAGGAGSLKTLPDSVRQILQMSREMDKVGIKMNKSFDNMARAAKSIASDYLKKAEQQLDQISRKAENRIRALDRLQKMDASQESVQKMQARVDESMGAAQGRLRDIQEMKGLKGPGMIGRIGGGLQIAGAALGAASQIAGFLHERNAITAQFAGAAGNELVQRRTDTYSGNLLNSIMNVRNRQDIQALAFSKKQTATRDWQMRLAGYASAVGIGGAVAMGTGAGTIAGPLGMGAGALLGAGVYGMYQAGKYFLTPQREAEKLSAFQQGRTALQAQSIDPYLYQRFRENSPAYARGNRLLQMNDANAQAFRGAAFSAQMTGAEAYQTATALRPEFGAGAATGITRQIMTARLRTGFDTQTLQTIMGGQAKFGVGGPKEAQANMEKIMTVSFSKGIEDSGLLEKMTQLVTAYQSGQTVATDAGRIANQIMSGIAPGQQNNVRSIEAAVGAQSRAADMYQEGGFRGFKKMQMSSEIAKKMGVSPDQSTDFQIALSGLGYEEGRKFLVDRGASPDILGKYDKFQFDALATSPSGKKAFDALDMKRKSGEQPTDAERKSAESALMATGYTKRTEVAAAAVQRYFAEGIVPMGEGKEQMEAAAAAMTKRMVGGAGATAEEQQMALQFGGMGKEDVAISKNIRQNMDAAISLFKEQADIAKDFGDEVGITTENVEKLDKALSNLIDTINAKTVQLGGKSSARPPSTAPVGNKGGG